MNTKTQKSLTFANYIVRFMYRISQFGLVAAIGLTAFVLSRTEAAKEFSLEFIQGPMYPALTSILTSHITTNAVVLSFIICFITIVTSVLSIMLMRELSFLIINLKSKKYFFAPNVIILKKISFLLIVTALFGMVTLESLPFFKIMTAILVYVLADMVSEGVALQEDKDMTI